MRARLTVEEEHRQAGRESGQHGDEQDRVRLDRPDEERDAHPRHPAGAHVVDRDDEVDCSGEGRDREDVQAEDPVVLSVARAEERLGERHVRRPAGAGCSAAREPAQVEHDAAEQVHPVRERVQARERDVAGTDHQRHEEVPEAGEDRHDHEEDHRRPVHRQDLVVRVLREHGFVRRRELRAHQHGEQAADDEEDERGRDVHDPDPLVVDGDEPLRNTAAAPRHRVHRFGSSRHSCLLPCRCASSCTGRARSSARRSSCCRPAASRRARCARSPRDRRAA